MRLSLVNPATACKKVEKNMVEKSVCFCMFCGAIVASYVIIAAKHMLHRLAEHNFTCIELGRFLLWLGFLRFRRCFHLFDQAFGPGQRGDYPIVQKFRKIPASKGSFLSRWNRKCLHVALTNKYRCIHVHCIIPIPGQTTSTSTLHANNDTKSMYQNMDDDQGLRSAAIQPDMCPLVQPSENYYY